MLAALVPTALTTPVGILLLASGSGSVNVIAGVLVLSFCASSITGYILGSIFLRRGASLARSQNEFLAAASHELRTPITSMRMFIEALQNERLTDPSERTKCLSVLQQEMVRLDGLVTKLIELSKLESDRQPFNRLPVPVDHVVRDSLAAFEAVSLGSVVQLDVRVEPNLWVSGDRPALAQALTNLLTNAWKYTGPEKVIGVMAKASGDREVELVVSDNGPGIPKEERKVIFEKFHRGEAAIHQGISGSGLGLAIVSAIVKAHSGRVELGSEPGGASFHLILPRLRERNASQT
jgi:two-component system phosphate regulon sensor histidine kinase PhoR